MEFLNAGVAVIAAIGFSIVFKVEKKLLPFVALLAFCGFFVKQYCVVHLGAAVELAVLCGGIVVGIMGGVIAKKIDVPSQALTLPAGIPMIPGYLLFESIENMIAFVNSKNGDPQRLADVFYYGGKSIFIIGALAFGLTIYTILFDNKKI